MPTKAIRPAPAEIQNRTWKSEYWAMKAAIGRPKAPPTPSIALTVAIDVPAFSRGTSVLSRLMPSGMAAAEMPWMPRPTMSSAMLLVTAVNTDPTTSAPTATSSRRRLPNMSPRRPMNGTATAATSSVIVNSHWTFATEVSSSAGRMPRTGIRTVCAMATTSAAVPMKNSHTPIG